MKTPQVEALPGMAPLGMKARAEYAGAKPLRPSKPQEQCDVGLFSDDAKQVDLMDLLR